MAWNLTAEFTETCSCNMLCPCWYGVKELMAQLAPSSGTHWSDPDMPRQFETKSGAVAKFTWF
jgi:hypothetical protein